MAVRENQQVLVNECMHLCRMHRRKTMVVQQSVELVLQFVNVAFYLEPIVYSLVQRCQWGSNVVGVQHAPLQTDLWIMLAKQNAARKYCPCHCRSVPAP